MRIIGEQGLSESCHSDQRAAHPEPSGIAALRGNERHSLRWGQNVTPGQMPAHGPKAAPITFRRPPPAPAPRRYSHCTAFRLLVPRPAARGTPFRQWPGIDPLPTFEKAERYYGGLHKRDPL